MAKKKRTNNLTQIVTAAAVLLGLVAIAMIFVPTIGVKDSDTTYTGMQLAFGYSVTKSVAGLSATLTYFEFSFMSLLTYILALAGTVVALMGLIKNSFASGLFRIIAAACFIVSGVFFFMAVNFCVPGKDISSLVSLVGGNIKNSLILAVGAYIGGITAIIAGVCELLSVFVFNK